MFKCHLLYNVDMIGSFFMNLPFFKVGDLAQLIKALVAYWLDALPEVCG